MKAMKPGDEPV